MSPAGRARDDTALRASMDLAGLYTAPSPPVVVSTAQQSEVLLWVPRDIRLARDDPPRLEWRREGPPDRPMRGCWDAFIRLGRDPTPERILAFARVWGVLAICAHGKPATHDDCLPRYRRYDHPPGDRRELDTRGDVVVWGEPDPDIPEWVSPDAWAWEPLEAWQLYSRQARAILRVAADLRRGALTPNEEWMALDCLGPGANDSPHYCFSASLATRRKHLAETVDNWLMDASIPTRLRWPRGDARAPELSFTLDEFARPNGLPPVQPAEPPPDDTELRRGWPAGTLFRVLAYQLGATIAGGEAWCRCHRCGELYRPKRRPRPGERNYCPDCGRGGRASKSDWWRLKRSPNSQGR